MMQRRQSGMTLIELLVATAILVVLSTMALPLARVSIERQKEHQLRADLLEMRTAIDRYKDAADRGLIQIQTDSQGYPPDLQTLVDGVPMGTEKIRFLRAIPKDPMTNSYEWGLRSVQDDPDSTSWGGQDVFDVYTTSPGKALDGTEFSKW
ncbi:MAG TPA: type II secretion system protein [Terriglobales bacterium]|jgi:general secretion pathway protein G